MKKEEGHIVKFFDWIKSKFSRDKPQFWDKYQFSIPFTFGRSISNQTVNETTAMQVVAVACCVKILSESVASLPLHVYEYTKNGKEKAVKHPLYNLLHNAPNKDMTSFTYLETSMSHMATQGNIYSQILFNGNGNVAGLYPLQPSKVTPERNDNGELQYRYKRYDEENPNYKDKGEIIIPQREMLHIPGFGFNGIIGYSPIAMARNAIGLSLSCEKYGGKFFENGGRPSGVLTIPTLIKNDEQLKRIQEGWQSQFTGEREGMTPVLEEGMKYEPISIPPEDAQFLETRKFQLAEIARIFRIPLHMLNDLDRATFSNIEQQSLEFVIYTLMPYITRIEQAMNKALLKESERNKYFIKFNLSGLLRGDYASRVEGYSKMIQNGVMSINDVRELEDLNKIPEELGGDLHIVNGNFIKLQDAGIYAKGEGEN